MSGAVVCQEGSVADFWASMVSAYQH